VFRAIGDQPSLREPLPEELARVDVLDDPAFSAPYFGPLIGRGPARLNAAQPPPTHPQAFRSK
jgi:hypothetical protein